MKKEDFKYVKWWQWLFLWVLPSYYSEDSGYLLVYKKFKGRMYITSENFYKEE